MRDVYRTIGEAAEYRQKIERSEFLGYAFAVADEAAFAAHLAAIRKEHFDATHHCWAFRLFADDRTRSSDDGEPSGSAGKPMLSAIESAELFDAGVVVVRWYGGVKLGTGGLSRAYRSTASGAIERCSLVERYVYAPVDVVVPFDRLSDAYRLVDPPAVILKGEEYGDANVFHFDVRTSKRDDFLKALTERRFTLR